MAYVTSIFVAKPLKNLLLKTRGLKWLLKHERPNESIFLNLRDYFYNFMKIIIISIRLFNFEL